MLASAASASATRVADPSKEPPGGATRESAGTTHHTAVPRPESRKGEVWVGAAVRRWKDTGGESSPLRYSPSYSPAAFISHEVNGIREKGVAINDPAALGIRGPCLKCLHLGGGTMRHRSMLSTPLERNLAKVEGR